MGELGPRQRSRRLKEIKRKAQLVLWFMKSYGLELTSLKAQDKTSAEYYTIVFTNNDSNNSQSEVPNQFNSILYFCQKNLKIIYIQTYI